MRIEYTTETIKTDNKFDVTNFVESHKRVLGTTDNVFHTF